MKTTKKNIKIHSEIQDNLYKQLKGTADSFVEITEFCREILENEMFWKNSIFNVGDLEQQIGQWNYLF